MPVHFTIRYHCFALSLLITLAACGTTGTKGSHQTMPSPTATTASPQIDAYLNHLAATGVLTGTVLVARGGTVLIDKGYGLADEDQHLPNTAQTRFRIGSITKQFTAMAILMLQGSGKLHVQDHLCLYIANCPQDWQPITLQNLLTHTSGIPDYIGFNDFPSLIGTPATVEQLISRFKDQPLEFTPGSRWSYSNSGYVLLGYIIEKLSGESYAEYLQQHIFTPLGMKNSGYDSNTPSLPEHATGYLSAGNKPVFLDMSEFYAAGALYSTVGDLYIWDQALKAHRLVSQAALNDMFAVHIPCPSGGCALPTDRGYGYGWLIADQGGQTYIYHWGRIDGFRSSNGFFPQGDVDVIMLSNLETTDTFGISTELGTMALQAH
ncbi:MAG TPA: serine hydrolase domain-containing protein [Ktedonobacterales bacterium]|nr:serine hydrolase domain-containing protein [Ktedonobacterales bacterium]